MEETCIIPNFNFDKDGKMAETLNRIFSFSNNFQNSTNSFQQNNLYNANELQLIKENGLNSVDELPNSAKSIKDVFVDNQGNSLVELVQIVPKEEVERQKRNAIFWLK